MIIFSPSLFHYLTHFQLKIKDREEKERRQEGIRGDKKNEIGKKKKKISLLPTNTKIIYSYIYTNK